MAPLANAALIEAAATAVVAHAEELTELDRAIGEANTAGASLVSACGEIGICLRTLKRWRRALLGDGDGSGRMKSPLDLMTDHDQDHDR